MWNLGNNLIYNKNLWSEFFIQINNINKKKKMSNLFNNSFSICLSKKEKCTKCKREMDLSTMSRKYNFFLIIIERKKKQHCSSKWGRFLLSVIDGQGDKKRENKVLVLLYTLFFYLCFGVTLICNIKKGYVIWI